MDSRIRTSSSTPTIMCTVGLLIASIPWNDGFRQSVEAGPGRIEGSSWLHSMMVIVTTAES